MQDNITRQSAFRRSAAELVADYMQLGLSPTQLSVQLYLSGREEFASLRDVALKTMTTQSRGLPIVIQDDAEAVELLAVLGFGGGLSGTDRRAATWNILSLDR